MGHAIKSSLMTAPGEGSMRGRPEDGTIVEFTPTLEHYVPSLEDRVVVAGLIAFSLGQLLGTPGDDQLERLEQLDRLHDQHGGTIGLVGHIGDVAQWICKHAPAELALGEGVDMYLTADNAAELLAKGDDPRVPEVFHVWERDE